MKIPLRAVLLITSIYILLPIIIFLFWWTNGWIGLMSALAVGIVVWTQSSTIKGEYFAIPLRTGVIMILTLIVWTLLSGAGHRGFFDGDFIKHNALFGDLITLKWPVRYLAKETGDVVYLVYYFAYYLPSALIGKWFGWQAGNSALICWTLGGVILTLTWLFSFISPRKQLIYGLLFPLFSGLDGLGKLIMRDRVVNNEWEWWGRNWQYSGNTTLLFYVPQHVLVGWILMGMIMFVIVKNKRMPLLILLLSTSLLWSPFVFLGIVPFYLILLFRKRIVISSGEIGVSLLIILISSLFLFSNMTFYAKETSANGWLWDTEKIVGSWTLIRLILFYLFEFIIFSFFILRYLFKNRKGIEFVVFLTTLVLLILFPWYKIGLMNDFAMRSSIPALYIIFIFWIRTIIEVKKPRYILYTMVTLLAIGSLYSFILISNGAIHFSLISRQGSLTQLENPKIRMQYLGDSKSLMYTLFISKDTTDNIGSISLK